MKKNTIICSIIAITILLVVIILLSYFDVSSVWNSWGKQEDGTMVYPTFGFYSLLILFKSILYFIPAIIISFGFFLDEKKDKKYLFCLLTVLNYWFLILLTIKLFVESVFELDKIFGFNLFNSVKDIQTLIGYVLTLILKKNYKIEPKVFSIQEGQFNFETIVKTKYECEVEKSTIKEIYQPFYKEYTKHTGEMASRIEGKPTDTTRKMGVYALYFENKLMKIGKAVDGGMFKRMGQYYRCDKTSGNINITSKNRDLIRVEYFNLDTADKCWEAERYLQSKAAYFGEDMPWENKTRN
ncbi:MAG: hypothetical protein K2M08_00995 [Anaeroplasmataceae bacterium]|nr:hypothetical protein [Anaeroplasmataceae bacterium]